MKRALLVSISLGMALWAVIPGNETLLAQSGTGVHLRPAELELEKGETGTVDIVVDNVEDLYGFDIRLGFNPAAVEVVDADGDSSGVQLRPGDLLSLDFVVKNEADNGEGSAWFAMTQLNPSEAVSGSGTAFSVTFRGTSGGATTPVTITHAQFVTRAGEEIRVSTEDGRIEIREVSSEPSDPTQPPSQEAATTTPTATEPPPPQPTVVTPAPTAPGVQPTATVQPPATALPSATATEPAPGSTPTEKPTVTGAEADKETAPATPTSIPTSEVESDSSPAEAQVEAAEAAPSEAPMMTATATRVPTEPREAGASETSSPVAEADSSTVDSPSAEDDGPPTGLIAATAAAVVGGALLLSAIAGIVWRPRRGDG